MTRARGNPSATWTGLIWISPWLVGFTALTLLPALIAAYLGLFRSITSALRKATTAEVRIFLVMCAGFVRHLVTRVEEESRARAAAEQRCA